MEKEIRCYTKEELTTLVEKEIQKFAPDMSLLQLYTEELQGYSEYKELEQYKTDADTFLNKVEKKAASSPAKRLLRTTVALASTIIIAVVGASVLFHYTNIYDSITNVLSGGMNVFDGNHEYGVVECNSFAEIPTEFRTRMPKAIIGQYKFHSGQYSISGDSKTLYAVFKSDDVTITLEMFKNVIVPIQYDNAEMYNTDKNNIDYYFYENGESNTAIWRSGNYIYKLTADSDTDTIVTIVVE